MDPALLAVPTLVVLARSEVIGRIFICRTVSDVVTCIIVSGDFADGLGASHPFPCIYCRRSTKVPLSISYHTSYQLAQCMSLSSVQKSANCQRPPDGFSSSWIPAALMMGANVSLLPRSGNC